MTNSSTKIVPHLWFDRQAKEAASFYTGLFPDSGIKTETSIGGTPSGDLDIITFQLWGNDFMAINAGPMFTFNPSVSFFVYCGSDGEIERLYAALSEGGQVMMPLDKYPWAGRYARVQDRYGLTWQLDVDDINSDQKIVPALLFVNEKSGRLKESVAFYTSAFPGSRVIMEMPQDPAPGDEAGTLLFAQVSLGGYLFNAMSGNMQHDFDFNEAVSFMVCCNGQEAVDRCWDILTAGGQEQPCGWLKDRFGVSWQVVPEEMDAMMQTTDKEQLARVTGCMLQMVKFDLDALKKAYTG